MELSKTGDCRPDYYYYYYYCAVPLACAGLLLGRIAPHDPRASPGAPHGHLNRARGVGVSHLAG